MRFLFITLFPEQIEQAAGHSIIKRAVDAGLVEVSCINPRDFATDRHRTVDDTPFGGGAGMVLKPEPMVAAIRMAKQQLPAARVIAMCPGGRTLKQEIVEEYAGSGQDLILVCGHYEGFDERIFNWVDEKLSIGDYVLTGGELPALIVMDAVARFIPGVLGKWSVPLKTPSAQAYWNILSIPARWNLKAWQCRKYCVTATMPSSTAGGVKKP